MNTSKVNGLPGDESQREQSHAVEARSIGRCVRWAVSRDLRDMAKAKLLEPQYPAMERSSLDYRIYITRPSVYQCRNLLHRESLDRWAAGNDPLKGTNRVPKSHKFPMHKRGIAYRARARWQRSLRSSPRTGKPSTWRREAGVQDAKIRRYA